MAQSEQVDVAVVGAGLAGLRAAERLLDAGLTVRVVEARDRVGGRTVGQEIGGATFDLGAQWIGVGQERMAALVPRLGLETRPQHHAGTKVLEVRGKVSNYKSSIPSLPPGPLIELERTMRRADKLVAALDPTDPLGSNPELDRQTVEQWKHSILSSRVQGLVDAMTRVVFGSEPSELSMLWFLTYLRLGGGLRRLVETEDGAQQDVVVGGAFQVARRLADGLGDVVRTGAPVRRIEQDAEGVTVLADGLTVRAKRAVVALAPALAGRIDFEPLLPPARDQLSQRMPMGATMKCFTLYDRPFWREQGRSGEVVSDGLPVSIVMDACTPDGSTFALLSFAVGQGARMLSTMTESERRAAVTGELARWFGDEALAPIAYGDLDWSRERWTRGCPTGVLQPGAFAVVGDALRAPVGRLHWAGTETARVWAGFMEGALESGERAADEVVAAERPR